MKRALAVGVSGAVIAFAIGVMGTGLYAQTEDEAAGPSEPAADAGVDSEEVFHSLRVVNGRPPSEGEVAWQVYLLTPKACYSSTGEEVQRQQSLCGGSLISHDDVLTAAHCFQEDYDTRYRCTWRYLEDSPIEVALGARQVGDPAAQRGQNPRDFPAITHGSHDEIDQYNDIAIVRLDAPMTTVPLPLSSDDTTDPASDGEMLLVSGYGLQGRRDPGDRYENNAERWRDRMNSRELLVATVPHVPRVDCQASLDAVGEAHRRRVPAIAETQLCAGYDEINAPAGGASDACQGDSGGALVAFGSDGWPYQVGIVSFGFGCGWASSYGVYTRVSAYTDWIRERVPEAVFLSRNVTPPATALPAPVSDIADTPLELTQELADAVLGSGREGDAEDRPIGDIANSEGASLSVTPETGDGGERDGAPVVRLGELFALSLTTPATGEITIFEIGPADADGDRTVVQLYPSNDSLRLDEPTLVQAGQTLRVPSGFGGGPTHMQAGPPVGRYEVIAVVSPPHRTARAMTRDASRINEYGLIEDGGRYLANLVFQANRPGEDGDQWAFASTSYWIEE